MIASYVQQASTGLVIASYVQQASTELVIPSYVQQASTGLVIPSYVQQASTELVIPSYVQQASTGLVVIPLYVQQASTELVIASYDPITWFTMGRVKKARFALACFLGTGKPVAVIRVLALAPLGAGPAVTVVRASGSCKNTDSTRHNVAACSGQFFANTCILIYTK